MSCRNELKHAILPAEELINTSTELQDTKNIIESSGKEIFKSNNGDIKITIHNLSHCNNSGRHLITEELETHMCRGSKHRIENNIPWLND